jgi:hypothetical protein
MNYDCRRVSERKAYRCAFKEVTMDEAGSGGFAKRRQVPVRIAGDLPGSPIKSLLNVTLFKAHQYRGFDQARSFSDGINLTGCNGKEEASITGILLTSFHQNANKGRVR